MAFLGAPGKFIGDLAKGIVGIPEGTYKALFVDSKPTKKERPAQAPLPAGYKGVDPSVNPFGFGSESMEKWVAAGGNSEYADLLDKTRYEPLQPGVDYTKMRDEYLLWARGQTASTDYETAGVNSGDTVLTAPSQKTVL